jgi:YHS domain-containing protein
MGSFLFEILDFIALVVFVLAVLRKVGSLFSASSIHVRTSPGPQAKGAPASAGPHRGETARDPVCGMFVSTELSQQLKRGTETLHFCSRECLDKFQKDAKHVAS